MLVALQVSLPRHTPGAGIALLALWALAAAAASVAATVPVVILVLIFQRRIVVGLTAGAVKG